MPVFSIFFVYFRHLDPEATFGTYCTVYSMCYVCNSRPGFRRQINVDPHVSVFSTLVDCFLMNMKTI